MRRTLHVGQLPSQTIIKRRRVDVPAEPPEESKTKDAPQAKERKDDNISDVLATTAPDVRSGVPRAAPAPTREEGPSISSDDEGDDEAELLREQQRLAKLKARNQSTAAATSGVASYNSDVLFRRTVPLSACNRSTNAKLLRLSNLQASKDHKDFLTHYFR